MPPSFFGLSTEYWGLPRYERHRSIFERVLALIHTAGDGPLMLRVGGDSADHTYWTAAGPRRLPRRAFRLTRGWLARTGTLARSGDLHLILDLNLIAGSPRMAAQWARAALAVLPRGSVAGFEVGNEPDLYQGPPWGALARVAHSRPGAGLPSGEFSPRAYNRAFASYARALGNVAPAVPLAGPAVANVTRDRNWVSSLIDGPHRGLGIVSAHSYPLSACVPPSSTRYSTISRLLGQQASTGMAQSVAIAAREAHAAGLRFRLTELNSVTCGGLPGVSNTFATALWAPDALLELLRAGVDGVNVHVRADSINTPFTLNRHGLVARPLLYGLILFVRTLGPGAELVPLPHDGRVGAVKVWVVRIRPDTLQVLLIDKGQRGASVDLHLTGSGPAAVQRLLAPSVSARSDVTLAGQSLGRDGNWIGRRRIQLIPPGPDGYAIRLAPASAALVTLHAAPSPGSWGSLIADVVAEL